MRRWYFSAMRIIAFHTWSETSPCNLVGLPKRLRPDTGCADGLKAIYAACAWLQHEVINVPLVSNNSSGNGSKDPDGGEKTSVSALKNSSRSGLAISITRPISGG